VVSRALLFVGESHVAAIRDAARIRREVDFYETGTR
jgi:hypothetical protein